MRFSSLWSHLPGTLLLPYFVPRDGALGCPFQGEEEVAATAGYPESGSEKKAEGARGVFVLRFPQVGEAAVLLLLSSVEEGINMAHVVEEVAARLEARVVRFGGGWEVLLVAVAHFFLLSLVLLG